MEAKTIIEKITSGLRMAWKRHEIALDFSEQYLNVFVVCLIGLREYYKLPKLERDRMRNTLMILIHNLRILKENKKALFGLMIESPKKNSKNKDQ
jgi:hypothetical protein